MSSGDGTKRSILIAIWIVAITVTFIGGSWHLSTLVPPKWTVDIQLPGIFVVLYLGWFVGPFQVIMSPAVVCILTIITNAGFYYAIVRIVLVCRAKLKGER